MAPLELTGFYFQYFQAVFLHNLCLEAHSVQHISMPWEILKFSLAPSQEEK